MENVTDRIRNPFGMDLPCEYDCSADCRAVTGYGDANADFHLIGDHPGAHGGREDGIPFGGPASAPLRAVLRSVGLASGEDPYRPVNCYCSYLHPCCLPGDRDPTDAEYDRLEPFLDAELRAIAAHVLLPVGDRPLRRVLEEYTSRARRYPADATRFHAGEIRGRGFLVVPVADPVDWTDDDRRALEARLRDLLDSDYQQIADLGRFLADDGSYMVR